ncbi:MAG: hypothetical protein KIT25_11420 [Enhydrobacter sp.]|nr:MAG: hypothetical protein KIT25_11420 [Enhydrobacter sp.]
MILRSIAVLVLALANLPAAAQLNWPDKPVKLVVGFRAGSATDVSGRMIAQKFSDAWAGRSWSRTSPAIPARSGSTASRSRHPTATH